MGQGPRQKQQSQWQGHDRRASSHGQHRGDERRRAPGMMDEPEGEGTADDRNAGLSPQEQEERTRQQARAADYDDTH